MRPNNTDTDPQTRARPDGRNPDISEMRRAEAADEQRARAERERVEAGDAADQRARAARERGQIDERAQLEHRGQVEDRAQLDGRTGSPWQDIKSRFVDDPAGAIAAAEELVRRAVDEKVRALKADAAAICEQDRGEDASSTENLRTRLIRYQDYCERLMSRSIH